MSEEERRKSLMTAAIELAQERGLALVTGREVAARARTSVGLVHYYFPSVEALIAELFENVQLEDLEMAKALVAKTSSPRAAIDALVNYFTPTPDSWRYRLWIDAWSMSPTHPLLGASARRLNVQWRDLLLELICNGVETGEFDVSEPKAAAWRILALLDAMHIQLSAGQIDASARAVKLWTRRGIDTELGGNRKS